MEKSLEHVPIAPVTGFPSYFPMPYRVPILVSLGLFLFATNITLLSQAGVDVEGLFYPSTASITLHDRRHDTLARPVYALALSCMAFASVGIAVFWFISASPLTLLDHRWLPVLVYAAFFFLLVGPTRIYTHERSRFLKVLRRVLVGGIDSTDRFLDIIIADVLTSYAKVFGDLTISTCLLVDSSPRGYLAAKEHCARSMLVPLAVALPYAIRLRQCLIEYRRTSNRWHLANAFKYFTAFPVILTSFVQLSRADGEVQDAYITNKGLYQLWFMSCIINAGYSFWWDLSKDWDLTLLAPTSTTNHKMERQYPGLRTRLTFSPRTYYLVILMDAVLRMLWSAKISTYMHGLTDYESGVFSMECLELVRRWMWITLRVECEQQRTKHTTAFLPLADFPTAVSGIVGSSSNKMDQD